MNRDKIIYSIYLELKDVLFKNVDTKYEDELKKNYLKYLHYMYGDKDLEKEEYEKLKNAIVKIELNNWNDVTPGFILSQLIPDDAFNKIGMISSRGYNYALEKIQSGSNSLRSKDADVYVKKLTALLSKVKEFNKEVAEQLVSEGILDYKYASTDIDITSLRIGHVKKY